MRFVTSYQNNYNGFQLDIVGFLAILGEGSLDPIAQVATLSYLVFLPRLLPAPQTFLRTARPEKLETTANAQVIGIHSGNTGENIHHVAHALHRGDKQAPNTVRCVRITENETIPRPSARRFGPLAWLAIVGFVMSAVLFALSIIYGDGMALLATICLSLLSTNTGIANKWTPSPNDPQPDRHSPPGDVVIKYPQGAFIVVMCDERTARYLYFNPAERCIYNIESSVIYRALSLVSTLLLMAGVISLANATIELQTGFAAAYMLINIFYWIGAALPPADHWDLSRLKVSKIEIKGGRPPKSPIVAAPRDSSSNDKPSYTEALWTAIAITKTKNWIDEAGWAPKTRAWEAWLLAAQDAAREEDIKIVHEIDESGGKVEVWWIRSWDYKTQLSRFLERPGSCKSV